MRNWITVHEKPLSYTGSTNANRLENGRELDVAVGAIEFIEPCRDAGDEPEDGMDYCILHLRNSRIVCCENRWEVQSLTMEE